METTTFRHILKIIRDNSKVYLLCILLVFFYAGCKKLVDVNPPATSLTGASIYNSDATAISAVTYLYTRLSATSNYFTNGLINVSLYAGLSADELSLFYKPNSQLVSYFTNSLSVNSAGYEFWNTVYPLVFTCNASIEGLTNSKSLTPAVKLQLLGEAKFMRAFFYFYLTNLYGDVPLTLSSDYKVNAVLPRTPKQQIYEQIIADLKDAQDLLSSNYLKDDVLTKGVDRIRPTKWAALALLSRVYLYTEDWTNAESAASTVINNQTLFKLGDLNGVFLKNSNEAIWQLQPVISKTNITNTQDGYLFIIPTNGPNSGQPVYLSDNLLKAFDSIDQRKKDWIRKYTDTTVNPRKDYYYPFKYKVNTSNAAVTEYIMLFRLAEQYLIRSEAKAHQNNIIGALEDLNAIRKRAGLANSIMNDQASLLTEILRERQVELFTEMGQRWLDLKRTGTVDLIMNTVCPQKGGTWDSYKQLYPIPPTDILSDPNLTQNTGY